MQNVPIIIEIQNNIDKVKNRLLEISSTKQTILNDNKDLEKQIINIALNIRILESLSKRVNSTKGLNKYHLSKKTYINICLFYYNSLKLFSSMYKEKINLDFRFLKDYNATMLNIKKNWLDSKMIENAKTICSNEKKLVSLEFEYNILTCKIKDLEAIIAMDESFRKKLI
jgi:hypothetical protein